MSINPPHTSEPHQIPEQPALALPHPRPEDSVSVEYSSTPQQAPVAAAAQQEVRPPHRRTVRVSLAAGTVIVLAGLVMSSCNEGSGATSEPSPGGPAACNIAVTGDGNEVKDTACGVPLGPDGRWAVDSSEAGDVQLRAQSERVAHVSAAGSGGPYAFAVIDTGAEGLKVRDSPLFDGRQIGSLPEHARVIVECRSDSGFNPIKDSAAGSTWYRMHWGSTEPGTDYGQSEAADPAQGWVFSYFTVPIDSDGEVPTC